MKVLYLDPRKNERIDSPKIITTQFCPIQGKRDFTLIGVTNLLSLRDAMMKFCSESREQ